MRHGAAFLAQSLLIADGAAGDFLGLAARVGIGGIDEIDTLLFGLRHDAARGCLVGPPTTCLSARTVARSPACRSSIPRAGPALSAPDARGGFTRLPGMSLRQCRLNSLAYVRQDVNGHDVLSDHLDDVQSVARHHFNLVRDASAAGGLRGEQ